MKKKIHLTEDELEKIIDERIKEAQTRYVRDYEKELLMKQADIRSLQSQINPHFLYNALESIRGQAVADGAVEIASMTQTLAKFFRYSISNKGDLVTVGDELDNVKNYILIQQFRFSGRFSYEVIIEDPDDHVENSLIPKLCLQPLVENAIIHGFKNITENGIIEIRVKKCNENVILVVNDNGCGIRADMLKRLSDLFNGVQKPENGGSHIGMLNVDRRLKLCFGDQYGLSINSEPGMGTYIDVVIPYSADMVSP